jgi:RNA polymerase sigma-54 factor
LARRFRIDEAELEEALREIRRLDPFPGSALGAHTPEYVIPDLVVKEVGDRFEVRLEEKSSPRLRIDPHYRSLVNEPGASEFLRGRLRSARWLMHALDRRRMTMIRVMEAIVERQRDFFTAGVSALQPLTLREIADQVGLHESTVARVTKDKYVETARGIFPLKFFFSSRISTESGRDTSARAVKSKIRELIEGERIDQPLSDEAIVRSLESDGIRLARRTVAKYRDQMRIARARFRRRSGSEGRRDGRKETEREEGFHGDHHQ